MQVVSLAAKILPPVPSEAAVPATASATAVAAVQPAADAAAERQSAQEQRVQFLQQNAGLLEKFSRDLLPSLLHVRLCLCLCPALRRPCTLGNTTMECSHPEFAS